MIIQDLILSICAIAFSYALIPQVILVYKLRAADQLSWQTVIVTSVGIWIMTITFFSMKLYFTAIADMFAAICWTLLLVAKILYGGYREEK